MIRITTFKAEIPALAADLLPEGAAVLAQDCRLDNGHLRPLRQLVEAWTPSKAGTIQTIHLFAGALWFHWPADVDVVRLAIPGDTQERTAFTDGVQPKVTDAAIATSGGGTDYPINAYNLGVPAPTTAASVSVSGAPDEDPTKNLPTAYQVTYVNSWGEEGPPSPVSSEVAKGPAQTVHLASIPTGPSGAYNVPLKRIYRTNVSSSGTVEFQFVTELPAATTTFDDNIVAEDLGEVLTTATFKPPPAALKGLIALPGGGLAGFVGNTVRMCEPGFPHAWPTSYEWVTEYPVVGLGAFGSSILVVTTGTPYVLTGTHPEAMSMEKLERGWPCVSKRSIVDLGYAIAYAAPDGLAVVGVGVNELTTNGVIDRDTWQALAPETMLGALYNGQYLGFYSNGTESKGIVFDPSRKQKSRLDFHATARYLDPTSGELYLINDGKVRAFDAGGARTLKWTSAPYRLAKPENYGAAQVLAVSYPLTFRLYADGALKHTQTVADAEPFRLPGGYLSARLQVEIEGTAEVRAVFVAPTIKHLKGAA